MPDSDWKTAKVEKDNHKSRSVEYYESVCFNPKYGDEPLRQVFIKGRGLKPATIITNDFFLGVDGVIRKYARRWLIETDISEHIHFFHLNRNCSGIVVKVDFDLTMTMLAHNLYRMLARNLPGFTHNAATTLYDKFIDNSGNVIVGREEITVRLNRKRHLPLLRESLPVYDGTYPWLGNKKLVFDAETHS